MSDIFREIDEDVRRDKAAEVFHRYRSLFLGVAVLLVVGTGLWSGWSAHRKQQAEAAAARFEVAIEDARAGRHAEAQAALDAIAASGPVGYVELARFRSAAEHARQDPAKAAAAFDALSTDPSLPTVLQSLARFRATLILADTLDREALQARLSPVLSGPWAGNAHELLGVAALKAGDFDAAGREFDAIVVDSGVAPSLRQRAELYLGLVRGGAVELKPKAQ
jgi:hypothetical protein